MCLVWVFLSGQKLANFKKKTMNYKWVILSKLGRF